MNVHRDSGLTVGFLMQGADRGSRLLAGQHPVSEDQRTDGRTVLACDVNSPRNVKLRETYNRPNFKNTTTSVY